MTIVRSRQSGITLLGFIIVLGVVGFFAFLGMKLYPAYYEYYNVVRAMEQIAKEPGSARWSPGDIMKSLEKRMYINYVEYKNVNKSHFKLKRAGTGYELSVKYERREHMIYNIDYVASFERTVKINGLSGDT